jgi:hypothetical protein
MRKFFEDREIQVFYAVSPQAGEPEAAEADVRFSGTLIWANGPLAVLPGVFVSQSWLLFTHNHDDTKTLKSSNLQ